MKQLKSGRKTTHGAYSYLATGQIPEHRRKIERFLSTAREELIQCCGGIDKVSIGQLILIDRIIFKLGAVRLMEEYCRKKKSIFSDKDGELLAPLKSNYLAWVNSIRLSLNTLGIDQEENKFDVIEYIQSFDAEKEKEQNEKSPE